jgi:hypothetical protein
MSDAEHLVPALLQILSRPGDARPVRLADGVLLRGTEPVALGRSLSPQGQSSRIAYLAHRLSIRTRRWS